MNQNNPEILEHIEEIFHAARELQGEDRERVLDLFCGQDGPLRRKVEVLLQCDRSAPEFLATPAVEMLRVRVDPGAALGPYEIVDIAGVGGMGLVYRARDLRLKRTVAIKALPFEFAHDASRLAGFEREATLLASLSHPNIAGIHDVIEVAGKRYLVLEFVEGITLAECLQTGPATVEETLGIARQLVSALEAAHEKGIVHRDLKPANIKLSKDGQVKVLDFGLAKIIDRDSAGGGSLEPISRNIPEADRSLAMGTPAYMSPEQAQAHGVDSRSDIWAFGCILYELLTGHKAFGGGIRDRSDIPVMNVEPDWNLLPARAPSQLHGLIRQCLDRDPHRRLQSARDLRAAIGTIQPKRRRALLGWAAAAAAVTVSAVSAALFFRAHHGRDSSLRVVETQPLTFGPELELDPALSPDGEWLAYVGGSIDHMDIYVRRASGGEIRNLTERLKVSYNRWPRWSPDGKWLAFVSDDEPRSLRLSGRIVQILSVSGGELRRVAECGGLGLAWSPDGKQLAYTRDRDVYVTTLEGGAFRRIASALAPHSPSWSPDGKWIAFVSGNPELYDPGGLSNAAASGILLVDALGGTPHLLTDTRKGNVSPVWMPDSRSILFLSNRGGSRDVFELRLSDSGTALGEPFRITAGLSALSINTDKSGLNFVYAKFSVSANIATVPIPVGEIVSSKSAIPLTTGTQSIEGINASRDGQWILYDSNRNGNQNIFKMSRLTGRSSQLTDNGEDDCQPIFSPDMQSIAFHAFRNGNRDLYVMSADGTNQQQLTRGSAQERYPDWSPDGQGLVYYSDDTGQQEVHRVSRENGHWGKPVQLTNSELGATHPRWSPDGRNIAYHDVAKGLCMISPGGGPVTVLAPKERLRTHYPIWSGDGRTLYFRGLDDHNRWGIWSMPATGGIPTLLVRFEDSSRFVFSTDDKSFFFPTSVRTCNIWSLRLER